MKSIVRAFALLLLCSSTLTVSTAIAQGILDYPVNTPEQIERLDTIAGAMRANLPVRAQIRQEKHMAVLAQPLISSGAFSLAVNGDIEWQIREPFAVRYSVQGGEITREVDGEVETITATHEPSVYGFFRMFEQLFKFDAETLKHYFLIYLAPASDRHAWDMALVPSKAPLSDVVATLIVSGDGGRVEKVTITEPGEDYTVLSFRYDNTVSTEAVAP
ncbi:outer membrane lipoprotein carrier protein LolA [Gilvimarinus chinensis]|uniref:outer membrane lipoprotein carrier protein LolA n=1 Tax=Gilvimarinus chinensis TaxID=396005 RepID=UPI00037481D1|nr:outer membrane lipoprotein carrier protein LolA [Gilvimarinus chinensis]